MDSSQSAPPTNHWLGRTYPPCDARQTSLTQAEYRGMLLSAFFSLIISVLSMPVINIMVKRNLRRKGFLWLTGHKASLRSQDRYSEQELKQRPWRRLPADVLLGGLLHNLFIPFRPADPGMHCQYWAGPCYIN